MNYRYCILITLSFTITSNAMHFDTTLSLYTLSMHKKNIVNCSSLLEGLPQPAVQRLDLSRNKLKCFDLKALLQKFPALQSLDVSANSIEKLHHRMLAHMPDNFVLNLSQNQVKTVCKHIQALVKSLRDRNITIALYDCPLPRDIREHLSESISSPALSYHVKQYMIRSLSLLLCGSSLYFFSQSQYQAQDAISTDSSSGSSVDLVRNNGMFAAGLCSIACCAISAIYSIIYTTVHDEYQTSKIFMYEDV